MSKAFTSGDAEPEVVRRPVTRAPPGEKRPITKAGRASLELKLRERLEERPALWAHDARADQVARREPLDAEVAQLQATLESTEVPERRFAADQAALGDSVQLVDESGSAITYRLVGPDEADARAGLLSVASPLGRALLGKRAGDEFEFQRPRGLASFTVKRVDAGE